MNWNEILEHTASAWSSNGGKNVKIAILDSGAALNHPALSHVSRDLHRFNVGRADYVPGQIPQQDDDVSDAMPAGDAHGTACLSVLGAQSPQLNGMAPEASIYVIKIANAQRVATHKTLTDGLDLALKLGVDIISVSAIAEMTFLASDGRVRDVFDRITASKTLLFSTLLNTNKIGMLNLLQYPSNQAESIVCGVLRPTVLQSLVAGGKLNQAICCVAPQADVEACTATGFLGQRCSSSFATAAFAGAAALLIGHWKETEASYARRSRSEFLAAFSEGMRRFEANAMLQAVNMALYQVPSTAV
jgi:Subtilase family